MADQQPMSDEEVLGGAAPSAAQPAGPTPMSDEEVMSAPASSTPAPKKESQLPKLTVNDNDDAPTKLIKGTANAVLPYFMDRDPNLSTGEKITDVGKSAGSSLANLGIGAATLPVDIAHNTGEWAGNKIGKAITGVETQPDYTNYTGEAEHALGTDYEPKTALGNRVALGTSIVAPIAGAKVLGAAEEGLLPAAKRFIQDDTSTAGKVAAANPGPSQDLLNKQQAGRDMFTQALAASDMTPEQLAVRQEQLQQTTGRPVAALHAATENVNGVQTQGGTLLGVASKAARTDGRAAKMAGEIASQGSQAQQRVGQAFDEAMGSNDYYGMANVAGEQKGMASPLYEKAFAANQSMASPEIDRILATPAGKKALAGARENMQNEMRQMGTPDADLGAQARDAGLDPDGGVAAGLNMRTLDYVKRELDAQTNQLKKGLPTGATNKFDVGRSNALATSLRNEMDRLDATQTPSRFGRPAQPGLYAQGRAQSASGMQMENALEDGEDFMKQRPEEVEAYMKDPNTSDPTKAAYAVGARRAVQDMMGDAQKAPQVWTQDLEQRLQHIVPDPNDFQKLKGTILHEQNEARNNKFLGSAANAGQIGAGKDMLNTQPSGALGRVAKLVTSPKKALGDEAFNFLNNQWQKRTGAMDGETAAEFMRLAKSTDPNEIRSLTKPKAAGGRVYAQGGVVNMAKGGRVLPRPKSYPAIEAMRKRNA